MKNFRVSGKHFMLTFKGHLKIKDLPFMKKLNTHKIFHEVGKTGYKHTHVVICFIKKFESRNVKCFDSGEVHPNIKAIKTKKHWERCINYDESNKKKDIEKIGIVSDTLNGNEYEWLGTYRTIIQAHKKWADVINDDYLTNVVQKYPYWAREAFDNTPSKYKFDLVEEYGSLLKWQEEVISRLNNQDKRKVMWIYDKEGNNGKSELSDHLEDNNDAYIVESANYKDIAYLWNLEETVVFDLVRSRDEDDFTPYRAIEAFKKGRITSTKYKPVRKRLEHSKGCKIVIFSNSLPDYKRLSRDRWDIGYLDKGAIVWNPTVQTNLPPRSLNIKGRPLEDPDKCWIRIPESDDESSEPDGNDQGKSLSTIVNSLSFGTLEVNALSQELSSTTHRSEAIGNQSDLVSKRPPVAFLPIGKKKDACFQRSLKVQVDQS